MFTPLPSPTAALSLEEVVARLAANPLVNGVFLFGAAPAWPSAANDYDILVVVDKDPLPVRSGITWIEGRLADLVFASVAEIARLGEMPAPLRLTDDWCGRLIRWLAVGTVAFDRAGLLGRMGDHLRSLPVEVEAPDAELYRRWDHANYNVAQSGRYVAADDLIYREAFDLRMTYQLSEAMVDYFRVRRLFWEGEKEAIRHWERSDPEFKRLFFACLHEPDRSHRFELYCEVVARALAPVGGIWPPYSTSMAPSATGDAEAANHLWLLLLGELQGE
jgi:hypothetical protein